MSDIITKAQNASQIIRTRSLPPSQRVWQALEALSGLILSSLNQSTHKAVEAQLVAINQITSNCDIEVEEGDQELTESDAGDILSRINEIAQLCVDSEAQRVMRELGSTGPKLPEAAIKEVREHHDIFGPLLIESLAQAIARVRNGSDESEEDASFFAMFLLAELEVDEALPVLIDAFRLPGQGPFELFGDAVHELIPPILALFSRGDTNTIAGVVGDCNVDMFVRWSAAQAYKYLVRDRLISKQDAENVLHQHFQDCVENEDYELLAPLACELGDLAAESALETIRSAYERHLVDDGIVRLEFIESQIAAGEQTLVKSLDDCRPTGIPDTIEELRPWAAFREEPPKPAKKPKTQPAIGIPRPHLASDRPDSVATIRVDHKVGRNDPCPCGSGRKFKKCCR